MDPIKAASDRWPLVAKIVSGNQSIRSMAKARSAIKGLGSADEFRTESTDKDKPVVLPETITREIDNTADEVRKTSSNVDLINYQISMLNDDTKKSLGMIEDVKEMLDEIDTKMGGLEAAAKSGGGFLDGLVNMFTGGALAKNLGSMGKTLGAAATRMAPIAARMAPIAARIAPGATIISGLVGARMMTDDAKAEFGDDFRKKLGGLAQETAHNAGVLNPATDAEFESITKETAQDLLDGKAGGKKDIERYGRENLERLAKGEKISPKEMRSRLQESEAVKTARAQITAAKTTTPSQIKAEPTATQTANITETSAKSKTGMTAFTGKGVGETGSSTEALKFFQEAGYSKEQAAGIVGNLQAESGPNMKTDSVGDGGIAYGIAQWHPDRQQQFAKVFGKDIHEAGFKEQLAFVAWELANTHKAAGNLLRTCQTAEQAAEAVDKHYEISSGTARGQRIANAKALIGEDGQQPQVAGSTSGTEAPANPTAGAAPSFASAGSTSAGLTPSKEPNVMAPGTEAPANPTAGAAPSFASAGSTSAGLTPSKEPNVMAPGTEAPANPTAGAAPSFASDSKPQNVTISPRADISKVNPALLKSFYQAATDYGKPVTIESAYRDDQYQAKLWVRGNILHEPGVFNPALPKTPQTVSINGQTYNVQGGGSGSEHAQGNAIDSPQAPMMSGILAKYGLNMPYGAADPVHVQQVGTSTTGMGGAAMNSIAMRGSTLGLGAIPGMNSAPVGQYGAADPVHVQQVGTSTTGMGGAAMNSIAMRGSTLGLGAIPGMNSAPVGQLNPLQTASTMIGPGRSIAGMSGNIGAGIPMAGSLFGAIAGLGQMINRIASSKSSNQNYRPAPNPDFAPDHYRVNSIPPTMPSTNLMRELFDLRIGEDMNPAGYAFGR